MWEDSILGEEPLGHNPGIQNIKQWLKYQHIFTLWDLSSWDNEKNWTDWKYADLPNELDEEAKLLSKLLQGKSPLNQVACDKRGWGSKSGSYTAAEGYRSLLTVPHVAPNPIQWNFVWSSKSIPKVDLFCWNVVHRSILTTENLRKRGLEGPSRCALCKNDEENIDHLLLSCSFSKEVWKEALTVNPPNFNVPELTADLFTRWVHCSPFQLSKKDLLKSAWMLLPKFIF